MKRPFPLVLLVLAGCAPKSEFDISPEQARTVRRMGPGSPIDLKHLPPGAVKTEKVFHKGDVLPDGTVAAGDRKMVRVEIKRP